MSMRKTLVVLFGTFAMAAAGVAPAQTKVAIGYSGWTGFAPLALAKEAGIFKKNGLDVDLKKIPQKDRHLAIASGDIQCAAKTVAASAPGTAPYFTLAWFLKKNGLSVKDVTVVNLEPAAAAQAFVAGQNDAAMTYEPYLSTVRENPQAGKIIATTLDYPMVMDTFGCTPKFLADNPKAAQALADGYFDALEMIKSDPKKSFEIMGADVKQTAEQFEGSQKYLRWQDRAANQKFFAGEHAAFSKEAADLLLEAGIIKSVPDLSKLSDTQFIK